MRNRRAGLLSCWLGSIGVALVPVADAHQTRTTEQRIRNSSKSPGRRSSASSISSSDTEPVSLATAGQGAVRRAAPAQRHQPELDTGGPPFGPLMQGVSQLRRGWHWRARR